MTDQPTEPTPTEAPAETEADLDTERDDTVNVVHGDVTITGQDNRDQADDQADDQAADDDPAT